MMLELNSGLFRLRDRRSEALTTPLDRIHYHTRLDLILSFGRSHPKLWPAKQLSHVFISKLRSIINLVIRPQTFLKALIFYLAESLIIERGRSSWWRRRTLRCGSWRRWRRNSASPGFSGDRSLIRWRVSTRSNFIRPPQTLNTNCCNILWYHCCGTVPVPTFDKLWLGSCSDSGSGSASYLDHKKHSFQNKIWKHLALLHSKEIDKFHQIYCKM